MTTKKKIKSQISKNFTTVTNRLLELIKRGTVPWHQPWHNVGYQNLITKKTYSGINPLLCQMDALYFGHSSPYYIGMAQCNERGWSVKKGSKATWLRWGNTSKITEKVENEQGQIQEKARFLRTFKWLMVFNADCIDDSQSEIKIIDLIPQSSNEPVAIKEEKIETFVSRINADITYGGNEAYHVFHTGKIYLPHRHQFKSRDSFWSTLFHELIHRTAEELNRPYSGDINDLIYHQEELVADIGASFLGNHFGLAKTELEHHASYLAHYWKLLNLDAQAFFKAVYQAQKAVNYLLELGGSEQDE
jgi:antirestriction protein ArdC